MCETTPKGPAPRLHTFAAVPLVYPPASAREERQARRNGCPADLKRIVGRVAPDESSQRSVGDPQRSAGSDRVLRVAALPLHANVQWWGRRAPACEGCGGRAFVCVQVLLAKRMGKKRIIAETGAGQHGVATATVCARFGLECIIYMGAVDIERQVRETKNMRVAAACAPGRLTHTDRSVDTHSALKGGAAKGEEAHTCLLAEKRRESAPLLFGVVYALGGPLFAATDQAHPLM
jgi:hypothetical protein